MVNSSFRNISFTNNENNQENSTCRTIDKSSDQILDTRTNIKYEPVKEKLGRGKKQWLTLKKKQAKVAKKKVTKLQAAKKKKLEKEIKKADNLAKKVLNKKGKKQKQ